MIKSTLLAATAATGALCAQGIPSLELNYDFPDFGAMLSADDYHGPVFKLSHDYPKELPKLDPEVDKILNIDFKTKWKEYAIAVRDYTFKDNINLKDNELSFTFSGEQAQKWFHVPWQHWGANGREGFHGLTKEGPLNEKQIAPTQTFATSAYAVGFYNAQGGYTIGQTWQNPSSPDLSYVSENGFPEGTVVAKFLFTTLGEDQVPQLANPVSWNAYVYKKDIPGSDANSNERVQTKVQLLQMDIMVKDSRATEANGWVFGTFAYNGALKHENPWKNLQPVGLMWGNDPEITLSNSNPEPTKTIINDKLKETVINDDASLPAQHLGWNSRLNGPADNPSSSCMSCHSTAQFPAISGIMPFLNNPPVEIPADGTDAGADWMRWFRNFDDSNTAFDPGRALTTDFSLQLSKSIQNFLDYSASIQQGNYAIEYWIDGKAVHSISRGAPQE
ncbi:hypothetical protein [Rubritalea marina]|uniref:hypothetical protein n=1 Tax=Rubritalea marina TaxID=361055 RepID=UPI000362CFF6|nr:hypothetical protein [Rubritalea marina]